jgi:Protein of unknown function (DUF3168)
MQTSLFELQKALFQRLANDTALMQAVTGVYDYIPEDLLNDDGTAGSSLFPYVTLGEATNTAFDTKTSFGENIVFTIHTWSIYRGKAESYNLANLIMKALKQPLSLDSGFKIARYEAPRPRVIKDQASNSYHGILEPRFYIIN